MRTTASSGTILVAVALLLAAPSARAVTFDFAAVAAGGPITWDAVTGTGEGGYSSFSMTVGGLTVTATASIPPLGPPPEPFGPSGPDGTAPLSPASSEAEVYLDTGAGMGVCKPNAIVGGGPDQCAQSDDDDVSSGETLRLVFSSAVTLNGIMFRNQDHGTVFGGGQFFLSVVGGGSALPLLSHSFTPVSTWSGTVFDFSHESERYSIESLDVTPVPEPTALGLLGAGLLLGGRRIRRRR